MENLLNKKVILIDDDEGFLKLMKQSSLSYSIDLQCFTGLDSLEWIGKFSRFDAAILDYHLEDMTGLEVASFLKSFISKMPVFLISGSDTKEVLKNIPAGSLAGVISKMAGVEEILKCVSDTLGPRIASAQENQSKKHSVYQ